MNVGLQDPKETSKYVGRWRDLRHAFNYRTSTLILVDTSPLTGCRCKSYVSLTVGCCSAGMAWWDQRRGPETVELLWVIWW